MDASPKYYGKAASADVADLATEATHAESADLADLATEATHAVSADLATEATHAASADTATEAVDSDTLDGLHATEVPGYGGFKNKIINGRLTVNQRDFDGDWSGLNVGDYGYDRWKKHAGGMEQVIESENIPAGTYTISWLGGGTGLFNGTSVASGDSVTVAGAGNVSVVVPTAATNVQVEAGAAATSYEFRAVGQEVFLCQRYFWRVGSCTCSSYLPDSYTYRRALISFPVKMRTAPSVSVGGVTYGVLSSAGASPDRAEIVVTVSSGYNFAAIVSAVFDAEL